MIQFGKVRNYLNQEFEFYIREWFPNAYKVNNDIYKTGDFNDTKTKRGDGSLVINIREKYAKDFATGEIAGDITSIGNQKQALDELVERYNLNFLEEEFLEQNINNDNDIIIKNTQQTNYSPLNVIPNCSELVELTPELSSESELSSKENKTVKRSALGFPSKQDSEKDAKIKNILSRLEHYKEGDPVDLYLKSRGITKYSNDTYIVNTDKMAILVNVCKKTITNGNKEIEETGKLYRVSDTIAGIQEIFLTKDGKKRETSATVSKIQRSFSNLGISGKPLIKINYE